MFSYEFSLETESLQPQNRCFVRGFRQFSAPHKISQNATPATELPCCHLMRPWQCDLQKTRNTTRLKCRACHAKGWWTHPKCCACHEHCNSSYKNVAKVLRLPHKMGFRHVTKHVWNRLNVTKCHTCHAERKATPHVKPPKVTPFAELTTGTAIWPCCEHKRNVERTHPQPPDPQSETGILAAHLGKNLNHIPNSEQTKNSPRFPSIFLFVGNLPFLVA